MDLYEAKKLLKKNGYIIEDTETLDDEINDMEMATSTGKNTFKMKPMQAKKYNKMWDRVRDTSLEKKSLNAVNFNIENFFSGLEEKFDEYLVNWKRHAFDYDTIKACQPVEYFFNDLMFVVKYFDEDGYIQVSLEDNKVLEAKKFKLTRVDENIEEVYDWIYSTLEDYET